MDRIISTAENLDAHNKETRVAAFVKWLSHNAVVHYWQGMNMKDCNGLKLCLKLVLRCGLTSTEVSIKLAKIHIKHSF